MELFHAGGAAAAQIFVYRDLWKWLNQPDRPPNEAGDAQLSFAWQG